MKNYGVVLLIILVIAAVSLLVYNIHNSLTRCDAYCALIQNPITGNVTHKYKSHRNDPYLKFNYQEADSFLIEIEQYKLIELGDEIGKAPNSDVISYYRNGDYITQHSLFNKHICTCP